MLGLPAAAARLAVAAAFFRFCARGRIHFAAVHAHRFPLTIGAYYVVCVLFYKLFKLLAAIFTSVLQYRHFTFFHAPYGVFAALVLCLPLPLKALPLWPP